MVALTADLISRAASKHSLRRNDENLEEFIARLTHLYLESRNLEEIGTALSPCRHLTVLYLYDNRLTEIPDLSHNHNLRCLYLQNNYIARITNLSKLVSLEKLYLGGNTIAVVEGLERLARLQELHVENQKLPRGEKLLFDPRTLRALAQCLQVLDISGNGLDSFAQLSPLVGIMQLLASDNQLDDMKELSEILSRMRFLWRLELGGNPVCQKGKFRERVILMASDSLEVLDGKEVNETARRFLQNWQASKEAAHRRRKDQQQPTSTTTTAAAASDRTLNNNSHSTTREQQQLAQQPHYLMPGLPKRSYERLLAKSAAPTVGSGAPVVTDARRPLARAAQQQQQQQRRHHHHAGAGAVHGGGGGAGGNLVDEIFEPRAASSRFFRRLPAAAATTANDPMVSKHLRAFKARPVHLSSRTNHSTSDFFYAAALT